MNSRLFVGDDHGIESNRLIEWGLAPDLRQPIKLQTSPVRQKHHPLRNASAGSSEAAREAG
jgi:hypothetical protein